MPPFGQNTIEDVLRQQGALTADQLLAIKLESINTGRPAEKIILERDYASPEAIAKAKAVTLGIPFVKLEGRAIAVDVLNLISEAVARRYKLIPFEKNGNALSVAMADPLDLQVSDFIERKSGLRTRRFLALPDDILKAIGDQYSQNLTSDVTSALKEVTSLQGVEEKQEQRDQAELMIREAPVANIVNQLLDFAVKSKASDIHVEPEEAQTRVRYRIDGILHEKIILPKKVHDAVVSRIKIMSNLKIDERRLPQDGRFNFKVGTESFDMRVSTLPTAFGEKVVMRLLSKSAKPPTLQELGVQGITLKNMETQLLRSHGIILICGPTGSGKTTTLYSVLSRLSTAKVNLLTAEDPIEYQIPGANQVQVNPAIGLTFASALRSFLRQDPNIILVGEIRDAETAELAIQAALTGHQVFSTIHTNSSSGALPRLLDMGIEPFLAASAINAALGQRILRKICPYCKGSFTPPPEVVENIKAVLGILINSNNEVISKLKASGTFPLYKGVGCKECGHSGYLGRIGIFELLVVSVKIMGLVLERASADTLEKQAILEGLITMKQDGYMKVLSGVTTLEEVLRVAQD